MARINSNICVRRVIANLQQMHLFERSFKFVTKTLFWLVSIIVLLSKIVRKETVFSLEFDERKLSLVQPWTKENCLLFITIDVQ